MTTKEAQRIIDQAYNAPAHVLGGIEWEVLEDLNDAIDGNPSEAAIDSDDAQFLQGILPRLKRIRQGIEILEEAK